jgi:hypothetical protein
MEESVLQDDMVQLQEHQDAAQVALAAAGDYERPAAVLRATLRALRTTTSALVVVTDGGYDEPYVAQRAAGERSVLLIDLDSLRRRHVKIDQRLYVEQVVEQVFGQALPSAVPNMETGEGD